MTTVKLSQLTELTTPSSNTEQTFLLVTDTQSGSPISKRMSVKTLDTLIDVTQNGANAAFIKANASFDQANAAFDAANSATATDTTQNNSINSAFAHANAAFIIANTPSDVANSASIYANAAFNAANSATATDDTQNTTIAFSYNHANAAFDAANSATATDATQNNSITSAFIHANSGFDFANLAATLALSFGAATILEVTNSGSSSYRFSQYGVLDNPNISTFSATTLGFNLSVSGHPFHIRTGDDTADFNTGLIHISTTGTFSYDSSAQGKESGTLFWRIPHNAVGNYKYRCANHPGVMLGDINIANTANIYFIHST